MPGAPVPGEQHVPGRRARKLAVLEREVLVRARRAHEHHLDAARAQLRDDLRRRGRSAPSMPPCRARPCSAAAVGSKSSAQMRRASARYSGSVSTLLHICVLRSASASRACARACRAMPARAASSGAAPPSQARSRDRRTRGRARAGAMDSQWPTRSAGDSLARVLRPHLRETRSR